MERGCDEVCVLVKDKAMMSGECVCVRTWSGTDEWGFLNLVATGCANSPDAATCI
jgi:hypothetical protein